MVHRIAWITMFVCTGMVGCGDASLSPAEGQVGSTADGLWKASAGEIGTEVLYDTGNTIQLSSWESVNCIGNVGGDNELITAISAYKEPSSNLDNFVDKLNIRCVKYETSDFDQYEPGFDPPITTNVFTGPNPRLPGTTVITPQQQNTVSTGVRLVVNANDYVKDVKLRYTVWYGTNFTGGSTVTTGGATGYSGTEVTKDCPSGSVLTGIAVRYSLNSGKIRQFKLLCHELTHT
ncbi:MAG TPA: hypothetical protein VER96_24470 [Polyangiaceae bacterium]|nr:hypothetical protein [Polyangiaceae bacterium]